MSRTSKITPFLAAFALLVMALGAISTPPSEAANEIVVSAADPASAAQETLDLEVSISGENFPSDAEVAFFVTGTTDPGGITVKSVKRKGPKNLSVRIDVASEATIADFDIQVTSGSNGRTGKGTELFKVVQKTNGGGTDSTPPGAVTDFSVDSVGFTSMEVSWTETADDGYDAASGPVWKYTMRYRTDGPVTDDNWDGSDTHGFGNGGKWGAVPGASISMELGYVRPETTFYVGIRAWDDEANDGLASTSNGSPVVSVGPIVAGSFPLTAWVTSDLDGLGCDGYAASFDHDALGRIGLACSGSQGTHVARWTGSTWSVETLSASLPSHPPTFFAFDPITDEPTFVSNAIFYRRGSSGWTEEVIARKGSHGSLGYSGGIAHVAYRNEQKAGRNKTTGCELARGIGGSWEIEVVDGDTECWKPQLALDDAGNPAVAYQEDFDGDGNLDGLKTAVWDASVGTWNVSVLFDGSGTIGSDWNDDPGGVRDVSLGWDPVGQRFGLAFSQFDRSLAYYGGFITAPYRVFFCTLGGGSWGCELVEQHDDAPLYVGLSYDTGGTAYLATNPMTVLTIATRAAGATTWTREPVDWGGYRHFTDVRIGPDGVPRILYRHDPPDDTPAVLKLGERTQ